MCMYFKYIQEDPYNLESLLVRKPRSEKKNRAPQYNHNVHLVAGDVAIQADSPMINGDFLNGGSP